MRSLKFEAECVERAGICGDVDLKSQAGRCFLSMTVYLDCGFLSVKSSDGQVLMGMDPFRQDISSLQQAPAHNLNISLGRFSTGRLICCKASSFQCLDYFDII